MKVNNRQNTQQTGLAVFKLCQANYDRLSGKKKFLPESNAENDI